jgi:hypothetical protein
MEIPEAQEKEVWIFLTGSGCMIGRIIRILDNGSYLCEDIRQVLVTPVSPTKVVPMIAPLPSWRRENKLVFPAWYPRYQPEDQVKRMWIRNVTGIEIPEPTLKSPIRMAKE